MTNNLYRFLRTPEDVGGGASSGDDSFAAVLEASLTAADRGQETDPEDAETEETLSPSRSVDDDADDDEEEEEEAGGEAADGGTEESTDADDSETAEEETAEETQEPDADARDSEGDTWWEFDREEALKREYAEAGKPYAEALRRAQSEVARLKSAYEAADAAYKARKEEGYEPTDEEMDARNDLRQDYRQALQRFDSLKAKINDAFDVAEERVRAWDFFRENREKFAGFSRSEIAALIDSGAVHPNVDITLQILHGRRALAGGKTTKGKTKAAKPPPPDPAKLAQQVVRDDIRRKESARVSAGKGSGRSPAAPSKGPDYLKGLSASEKALVREFERRLSGDY